MFTLKYGFTKDGVIFFFSSIAFLCDACVHVNHPFSLTPIVIRAMSELVPITH